MTHEQINRYRTCHPHQCNLEPSSSEAGRCKNGAGVVSAIWNFTTASLSVHRHCRMSRKWRYGAGTEESFYRKVTSRAYQADSATSAKKWEEHQRYCHRSVALFFNEEVILCQGAMKKDTKWCLSIISIDYMPTRLRMFTSC